MTAIGVYGGRKAGFTMRGLGAQMIAEAFPHWMLWAVLLALAAAVSILGAIIPGVSLSPATYQTFLPWPPLALVAIAYKILRQNNFDWFMQRAWALLMLMMWVTPISKLVGILGLEIASLDFPLVSGKLVLADQAIGFDWNAYAKAMLSSSFVQQVLYHAYNDGGDLAVKLTFTLPILLGNRMRLVEACFLSMVTGIACILIGGFLPAYPAFNTIAEPSVVEHLNAAGIFSLGGIAEVTTYVREARPVEISPDILIGVVNFPSYHCCVGLLVIICNRGLGWFSLAMGFAGLFILLSTPIFGGHYLIDLIGGASLMAATFAAWIKLVRPRLESSRLLQQSETPPWPLRLTALNRFAYKP